MNLTETLNTPVMGVPAWVIVAGVAALVAVAALVSAARRSRAPKELTERDVQMKAREVEKAEEAHRRAEERYLKVSKPRALSRPNADAISDARREMTTAGERVRVLRKQKDDMEMKMKQKEAA